MSAALEHVIVSPEEMQRWPYDRASSGEKRWAETTWGTGPLEGDRRLFYNWNTWPCRVVFRVDGTSDVARGEALWRRSRLSIRMKGLKLVSAVTGTEITDARVTRFDQAGITVEFRAVDGPGLYYLYYAAYEDARFKPTSDWLARADAANASIATPLRIEARCQIDDFDAMETIALPTEVDAFRKRFASSPYLVFPEDRDRSIKLQFDLPMHWALEGPRGAIALHADRHEYRVFQLGIRAMSQSLDNVKAAASDLTHTGEASVKIDSSRVQCVTLESRIKSRYIERPSGVCPVPQGQTRALWFGIDIPENAKPGEYRGRVTVTPTNAPPTTITLVLNVSDTVVPERGDHELHRLSRLRWLESDVGLSDKVYPPYKPLRVSRDGRTIKTWGHTIRLAASGLPDSILVGKTRVTGDATTLTGHLGTTPLARNAKLRITRREPGVVEWIGESKHKDATLTIAGRMEYDGSIVIDASITSTTSKNVRDLTLRIPWSRENAWLGTGMGYQGRREGGRSWRSMQRGARAGEPAVWMGSVEAGLGWKAWAIDRWATQAGMATASSSLTQTDPWQDSSREDAITITEQGDAVVLTANLGDHTITPERPWAMRFAFLPTPVKPADQRHWQFRYMHKGGGFWPREDDTPQSFLKDNCKRLDAVAQELGVKRLNLHDWWGPAFNYAWQWDGPDNLSRLTGEAHKRGMFVKVYNSGRELSSFAPEFWAIVYEGSGYKFRDDVEQNPRLWFQDAWRQNHLPDGLPSGWPRLHEGRGNEHAIPVSNATRNGNFYLESMRYMTRFFGTDGAYWDGADGPGLGHREMAKRLWVMFRETNRNACIDVHHGHALTSSPVADHMLCFPFIDSLWHGEGFDSVADDPHAWLVEIAALPFGVPSEMLGMDDLVGKGMLFGIWSRHGWYQETDVPRKLWRFFDRFRIEQATMLGWWQRGGNGVTVDRPHTLVTAYKHPRNGVLLAIGTWHKPLAAWMEMAFDVSLRLDRRALGLPRGKLKATDILSEQLVDIDKPIALPDMKFGRLLWVRK